MKVANSVLSNVNGLIQNLDQKINPSHYFEGSRNFNIQKEIERKSLIEGKMNPSSCRFLNQNEIAEVLLTIL